MLAPRATPGCAPARTSWSERQFPLSSVQDLVCDWQQAASDVLVAVGRRFISMVMEELLHGLQPGILPHYFVVRTLANLSVSNGRWRLGLDSDRPGRLCLGSLAPTPS